MIIEKATIEQYEAVKSFYHSLIDGLQDSIYDIGWKKDVYPDPDFLINSISRGELFIGITDGKIMAAMVINHESNEGYQNIDWPTKARIDEVLGFLTTLFLINPVGIKATLIAMLLAFIIFRILDITKIGPIYKSQSFGNGVGVVLDDFLAGIIGNFILVFIWTKFFY